MGRKALSGTVLLALLFMGVLASVLVAAPSTASSASEPPEVEWERYYGGGADDDRPCSVKQTRDGGYILAGDTLSLGVSPNPYERDAWVVKTSPTGSMQWNRTYGVKGYSDQAYCVQQTRDGGYIIAGYSYTLNSEGQIIGFNDAWLLKTSSTGVTEWSRTYGQEPDVRSWDCANSVLQTSDGGYVFAGSTYINGTERAPWSDFWLVKTSSTGVMEWNRTYGGASLDEAYSVQQTSDGGYILAGYTSDISGYDFLLVKTNSAGAMEWSQTYGGGKYDFAGSVLQTSDGGYIVVGGVFQTYASGAPGDCWVVKTNSAGPCSGAKPTEESILKTQASIPCFILFCRRAMEDT